MDESQDMGTGGVQLNTIRDLTCWLFFTALLAIAALVAAILSLVNLLLEPRGRR